MIIEGIEKFVARGRAANVALDRLMILEADRKVVRAYLQGFMARARRRRAWMQRAREESDPQMRSLCVMEARYCNHALVRDLQAFYRRILPANGGGA